MKVDKEDERLVRIDEDSITVDENVESYCIMCVGTSRDDNGNAVYGVNLISSEQVNKPVNDAEAFVRRAVQLLIDDMDENEKEKKEEP